MLFGSSLRAELGYQDGLTEESERFYRGFYVTWKHPDRYKSLVDNTSFTSDPHIRYLNSTSTRPSTVSCES